MHTAPIQSVRLVLHSVTPLPSLLYHPPPQLPHLQAPPMSTYPASCVIKAYPPPPPPYQSSPSPEAVGRPWGVSELSDSTPITWGVYGTIQGSLDSEGTCTTVGLDSSLTLRVHEPLCQRLDRSHWTLGVHVPLCQRLDSSLTLRVHVPLWD